MEDIKIFERAFSTNHKWFDVDSENQPNPRLHTDYSMHLEQAIWVTFDIEAMVREHERTNAEWLK
jgi:hypothetical protein